MRFTRISGERTLAQASDTAQEAELDLGSWAVVGRPMTYEEYEREGLPWLTAVFADANPNEPVFAEGVQEAAIFYPAMPLTARQLDAVGAAAANVGDDALYLTMLERSTSFRSTDGLQVGDPELISLTENWLLPLDDLRQYTGTNATASIEHALHSPRGRWAVVVSHMDHGVVAGDSAFVQELLDKLSGSDEGIAARSSVESWLRDMRDLHESLQRAEFASWVPRLALSVYGPERGRALLSANGWQDFEP